MSESDLPENDRQKLRRILEDADGLLLDFDGPICSIFGRITAEYVAEQLRRCLPYKGRERLPATERQTKDPFTMLSFAVSLGDREGAYTEQILTAYEIIAATTAPSTAGAQALIEIWKESGRKLAVVTNNSYAAAEVYLTKNKLYNKFDYIAGRRSSDLSALKPGTAIVAEATRALGCDRYALIGDSKSDIIAAKKLGINSIAFANKRSKQEDGYFADADVVVDSLNAAIQAIKR